MAVAMQVGVVVPVTVGTTLNQLTRAALTGTAKRAAAGRSITLLLWSSDVDIIVVATSLPGIADGGAVPTHERRLVPFAQMPAEIDISGESFVGVAAAGAGTVQAEFRQ